MATVLDVLLNELEEEINARKDALAMGRADDFPSYTRQVGIVTGLSSVVARLKDLQKYEEEN